MVISCRQIIFFREVFCGSVRSVIETDRNCRKKEHTRKPEENACDQAFLELSDMPCKHYTKSG